MKTQNFRVYYTHGKYNPLTTSEKDMTTCHICDHNGNEIISASVGRFHKDTPNRKVAVRESFKKATEELTNKNAKRELWMAFAETNKKCLTC